MEKVIARNEFENLAKEFNKDAEKEIFGEKVGLIARIFGCYYTRMSRPVTTKNITYRYCPKCGIRRRYNMKTFKSEGSYYYPSNNKELHHV